MNIELIRNLISFVILCLAQALVLNRINLFGCATPLLYVYFIMSFRRDFPKWAVLLWSFMLGLCVDVFSNTPGVAASAATFFGLTQPYLLNLFTPRDSPEDFMPTIKSLGAIKYLSYTFISVLIYNVLFFSIEAFSFFDWLQWLKNIGGSTVLTIVLILAIEHARRR